MRGNAVFADAFNYLLYDGRAVIEPENLKEMDSAGIALPFGARDGKESRKGKEEAVQKYRDLLKNAVFMEDGKTAYVLLGIENQTDIHYAMPVKNAIYDALQYGRQVSDTAAKHRADRKKQSETEKKVSGGEYLSGFYREDRLTPVITLVIHFGAKEWDGPLSLHEMIEYSWAMKSHFWKFGNQSSGTRKSPILCLITYPFLLGYWSRPCRICGA